MRDAKILSWESQLILFKNTTFEVEEDELLKVLSKGVSYILLGGS